MPLAIHFFFNILIRFFPFMSAFPVVKEISHEFGMMIADRDFETVPSPDKNHMG